MTVAEEQGQRDEQVEAPTSPDQAVAQLGKILEALQAIAPGLASEGVSAPGQGETELANAAGEIARLSEATSGRQGAGAAESLVMALRFVHVMLAQLRTEVSQLVANQQAAHEVLVAEGVLPLAKLEKRREQTEQREAKRVEQRLKVEFSEVDDKYALTHLPQINCFELLPLCKARCCSLKHLLAPQDLDEGVIRWDYGEPYVIAREPDGRCVHNREGPCDVYAKRPASCRTYDCRSDPRIWQDFATRTPAP